MLLLNVYKHNIKRYMRLFKRSILHTDSRLFSAENQIWMMFSHVERIDITLKNRIYSEYFFDKIGKYCFASPNVLCFQMTLFAWQLI